MPIWRLQVSWLYDTAAAKDKVVITPHFNDVGATTDPQNLCDDLLAGLQTITNHAGEVQVKAYDAQGSVPVYPEGDAIVHKGTPTAVNYPRELAVCLSFYGERNVKRQRGRLYLPLYYLGLSAPGLRPSLPIAKIDATKDLFANLGGPDVDWCVYSRVLNKAFSVTDWWYDNEWDIQRSRGGRGLQRMQGVTSEARGGSVQGELVSLV